MRTFQNLWIESVNVRTKIVSIVPYLQLQDSPLSNVTKINISGDLLHAAHNGNFMRLAVVKRHFE